MSCSEKGLGYWNTLHTTLSQDDPKDRDDNAIFEQYYHTESVSNMYTEPTLRQTFENRGIDVTQMHYWATSSIDPTTNAVDESAAYYNVFDTKSGIIIAEGNWRNEDKQQKLPWSEIIYQTWDLAESKENRMASDGLAKNPGAPISNLQSVVRHDIANRGTQAVLAAAYQANGLVPGKDGDDQWRPWTEADHRDFFHGLLGTDNVKGVIWLLNDHAAEIGKKEISTIWSRWAGSWPDLWIDIAPSIWSDPPGAFD
ncbi:MAG: hypothetical protein LQ352_002274 [Teloschistes flavicans]|nr:MAG: hypothetical protein LQ352_002274 [Teloschistes flavicans]